jgi:hypothetical protein
VLLLFLSSSLSSSLKQAKKQQIPPRTYVHLLCNFCPKAGYVISVSVVTIRGIVNGLVVLKLKESAFLCPSLNSKQHLSRPITRVSLTKLKHAASRLLARQDSLDWTRLDSSLLVCTHPSVRPLQINQTISVASLSVTLAWIWLDSTLLVGTQP